MGDGVWFYGVHDAFVIAVDPSLIRLEHDGHNDEGQCRCGGNKQEEQQSDRVEYLLYLEK